MGRRCAWFGSRRHTGTSPGQDIAPRLPPALASSGRASRDARPRLVLDAVRMRRDPTLRRGTCHDAGEDRASFGLRQDTRRGPSVSRRPPGRGQGRRKAGRDILSGRCSRMATRTKPSAPPSHDVMAHHWPAAATRRPLSPRRRLLRPVPAFHRTKRFRCWSSGYRWLCVDSLAALRSGVVGNRRCDPVGAAPPAARAVHAAPPQPLAALTTVAIIVVIVILPLTMLTASLLTGKVRRIRANSDGRAERRPVFCANPRRPALLGGQFAGSLWADKLPRRPRESVGRSDEEQPVFASQAINIGQNTFDFIVSLFVMLYLLFFLLRDGDDQAQAHQGRDSAASGATARALRQVHRRHPRDGQG